MSNQLYAALHSKVGLVVRGETKTDNQLRIIARIPREAMPTWLKVMSALFKESRAALWDIDISKQYFPRDESDDVVFGWRLILQGEKISQHIPSITNVIIEAPIAVMQLDEVPLVGSAGRNSMKRGKGAQHSGKAVVGPMAFAQQREGG